METSRSIIDGRLVSMESCIRFLETVDSTNTYVLEHFAELPDGAVVFAGMQTSGRGRRGRVWQSPPGVNLYATLVLKSVETPFLAGSVAGIAGLELVRKLAPEAAVYLKWPNDLYIRNCKLGGILCEGSGFREGKIAGIAAGLGLNIHSTREDLNMLEHSATSLALETGRSFSLPEVRRLFAEFAVQTYAEYRRNPGELFLRWKRENRLIGCRLRFMEADGCLLEGVFADIAPTGEMILETPGGKQRKLHCGDVQILKDSIPRLD